MRAEIGADAIGDDRAVGADVEPVDDDLAVRVRLLEFLETVHDALGALLRPVLARRVDADEHADRAFLREERRHPPPERLCRPE